MADPRRPAFLACPGRPTRTYYADNNPVKYDQIGPLTVRFTPPPETEYGVQKELTVSLADSGSRVNIALKVTNIGPLITELAP